MESSSRTFFGFAHTDELMEYRARDQKCLNVRNGKRVFVRGAFCVGQTSGHSRGVQYRLNRGGLFVWDRLLDTRGVSSTA